MDYNVLKELLKRESYQPLKDALPKAVLYDFQSIDLAKMMLLKRTLVSYDTGMGKTILASAFMYRLLKVNPGKKFIFFGKLTQLHETSEKIKKFSGMSVLALDATENSLNKLYDRDYKYDILFMTPESLTKELFMNKIYEMKDEFVGIVIDEAHLYCNYQESMNAQMLEALSSYFDYVVGLTATPISSKLKQLSSVLRIVNPYVFIDHRKTMEYIKGESDYIKCTVINRSRDKNLHNGILVPIPPMEHQIGAKRRDELLVKGAKGLVQHAYLLKILEMTGDKKALVYVNRKEIYSTLMERMKQYNIPCAMINGDTKLKDQTRILEEFSQDKYKVLFTNKTTSLDIECDIVIFYELVIEVQQFIGRSGRGIEAKHKDVYFLVTEDTFEEDYFWDTIYNRMIQIKSVLGKDVREVTDLGRFRNR